MSDRDPDLLRYASCDLLEFLDEERRMIDEMEAILEAHAVRTFTFWTAPDPSRSRPSKLSVVCGERRPDRQGRRRGRICNMRLVQVNSSDRASFDYIVRGPGDGPWREERYWRDAPRPTEHGVLRSTFSRDSCRPMTLEVPCCRCGATHRISAERLAERVRRALAAGSRRIVWGGDDHAGRRG